MKTKRLIPRIILTIVITAAFVGWMWMNKPEETSGGSGTAAIGGAFMLTDTQGHTVTEEALRGNYSLVFFGFTHCPEVCPTALMAITEALEKLGRTGDALIPVFITVDPERDSPQVIAEYLENFHPAILGLTGTKEAVDSAQYAYKVFATKEKLEGMLPGEYTVNHSSYLYLMDPEGRYVKHFTHTIEGEALAQELAPYLEGR